MRNYFYGINRNVNINSRSFEGRNVLLSSDNDKISRYGDLAVRQSGVAQQTITFGAIDPSLKGNARLQAIQDRADQVNQITKGNPNIKLTPEAFNKLASGNAVAVDIQLNAPDRRNLAVTAAVGLTQIIGGLAGAGYNKEQGDLLINRAKADADFVTKHGNNYDQGFFGVGAQFQDGTIKVRDLAEPEHERSQIQATEDNKKVNNLIATNNISKPQQVSATSGKKSSVVASVDDAGKETNLSVQDHRDTTIDKDGGGTIEDNANQRLSGYLKQLNGRDLAGTGIDRNELNYVIGKLESGKGLDPKNAKDKVLIDQLRNIGFSIGQDNGGNQGVVTSIIARDDYLKNSGAAGKLARAATADYLQVAVGAGLIKQEDLDKANSIASPTKKGEALAALFNQAEERIKGSKNADGSTTIKDLNGKDTGIDSTNLKVDHLIGGQHITNLQYVINQRIKQNTDAAKQINDVVNGDPSAKISSTTAAIYNKANGTSLSAAQIEQKLKSGDLTGVNKTLDTIGENIGQARKFVTGKDQVAGGLYGTRNTVLQATLKSTDGVENDANRTVGGKAVTGRDFFSDVKDLKELVAFRQKGGEGSVTGADGKSTTGSIATQASTLESDFKSGNVTQDSQNAASSAIASQFNNQLKANGVTGFTDAQVERVVKAAAGKLPEAQLDDNEKKLLSALQTIQDPNKALNVARATVLGQAQESNPVLVALAKTSQGNRDSVSQSFNALKSLESAKTSAPSSASNTVTLSINGTSETGSVGQQADRVTEAFKDGTKGVSAENATNVKGALVKGLQQEVGSGFDDATIASVAQGIAAGKTDFSANPKEKELFDKISSNPSLVSSFKSVGNASAALDKAQTVATSDTNTIKVDGSQINVKGNVKAEAERVSGVIGERKLNNADPVKKEFTGELSSQLQAKGIKAADGSNFSEATIAKVAQGIASTDGKGDPKFEAGSKEEELFKQIKGNTELAGNLAAVGSLFNKIDNNAASATISASANTISGNASAVSAIRNLGNQQTSAYRNVTPAPTAPSNPTDATNANQVAATSNVTGGGGTPSTPQTTQPTPTPSTSTTSNPTSKSDDGASSLVGLAKYNGPKLYELRKKTEDIEAQIASGKGDPNDLKNNANRSRVAVFARNTSDFLEKAFLQDDNGKPRTLGDRFTAALLAIADEILSRVKSQNQYFYGFGQNATISTSQYKGQRGENPLSQTYELAKRAGDGITNGLKQVDKYTRRRDDEAAAKGEKLSIKEAVDQFKKNNSKNDETNAEKTGAIESITGGNNKTVAAVQPEELEEQGNEIKDSTVGVDNLTTAIAIRTGNTYEPGEGYGSVTDGGNFRLGGSGGGAGGPQEYAYNETNKDELIQGGGSAGVA